MNSDFSSSNFLCFSSAACCGFERAVAHVLAGQRRRDDQHLGERLAVARFEDHAADARVERQARQVRGRWRSARSASSTAPSSPSSA